MFHSWSILLLALSIGFPPGDWLGCPEDLTAGPGSTIVVPVRMQHTTGFTSAEMALAYDPAVLEPVAVTTTSLTTGSALSYAVGSPGFLDISLHAGARLAGRGDLVWVVFHVLGSAGDGSAIRWIRCELDRGLDRPGSRDGHVRVIASETTLSLPDDLVGAPGEFVIAPLSAAPADGIEGADITVEFNEEVIWPQSVSKTPISDPAALTFNLDIPGKVLISLFTTTPLAGTGPLVDIEFEIVGLPGESTPLDITNANLNEGAIEVTTDSGFLVVCDHLDADDDGVSLCDGDCDDDDGTSFPGNEEIGCDGRDNDCDPATSDILDADSDTFPCDVDCDDGDPGTNPDAVEVCDGIDNDCAGGIDDVPPPVAPVAVSVEKLPDVTRLSWAADPAATGYDVVRGSLAALVAGAGDYVVATETCLADDIPETQIDDSEAPLSSEGFWYLVRAVNCGGTGSYDGGGPRQAEGRDAEIDTSPGSCP